MLNIELDIFDAPFAPLTMAEVEFPNIELAHAFIAPDWFDEDVTNNLEYHNSNMSMRKF
jgi:CYTH domain-containing protein